MQSDHKPSLTSQWPDVGEGQGQRSVSQKHHRPPQGRAEGSLADAHTPGKVRETICSDTGFPTRMPTVVQRRVPPVTLVLHIKHHHCQGAKQDLVGARWDRQVWVRSVSNLATSGQGHQIKPAVLAAVRPPA